MIHSLLCWPFVNASRGSRKIVVGECCGDGCAEGWGGEDDERDVLVLVGAASELNDMDI